MGLYNDIPQLSNFLFCSSLLFSMNHTDELFWLPFLWAKNTDTLYFDPEMKPKYLRYECFRLSLMTSFGQRVLSITRYFVIVSCCPSLYTVYGFQGRHTPFVCRYFRPLVCNGLCCWWLTSDGGQCSGQGRKNCSTKTIQSAEIMLHNQYTHTGTNIANTKLCRAIRTHAH